MGVLTGLDDLLRGCAPQVLGAVVRRYGDFDTCEDAVQEALLAAARQWPAEGVPEDPRAWLIRVASRRRIELLRSETARRRREAQPADPAPQVRGDDELTLLLLCCHPALTPVSQVALTLRAAGGLTTAEIARALLVPESTVGQRISRAKQRIRAAGARFAMPPAGELGERLTAVRQVLYLIFNEGYTASSGARLHRVELSAEAIRLTRQLHARLPGDGEVAGLLALMLLTDARRPARSRPDGALVPLAEQDRRRWDRGAIAEGIAIVTAALRDTPLGPFQVQAAIAAVHDEAPRAEMTDWVQIRKLYDILHALAPGPMVTLNRVVATAEVDGPVVALRALEEASDDPALAGITGSWRFGRICWSGSVRWWPLGRLIWRPRGGRSACPSSAIWRVARRGCTVTSRSRPMLDPRVPAVVVPAAIEFRGLQGKGETLVGLSGNRMLAPPGCPGPLFRDRW